MELVRPAAAVVSMTADRCAVTEDEFRLLYERTARPLRGYLYRMLNDMSRTDDILQETYLRQRTTRHCRR
jgi:DNA-directed RNA polymerase specialized sigma24 family protein